MIDNQIEQLIRGTTRAFKTGAAPFLARRGRERIPAARAKQFGPGFLMTPMHQFVEGLTLLLSSEEAKTRLGRAFVRKAFDTWPLFAFPYDEADIDWTTGSVKIPKKKDRFTPAFLRSDFYYYFLEAPLAQSAHVEEPALREARAAHMPANNRANIGPSWTKSALSL